MSTTITDSTKLYALTDGQASLVRAALSRSLADARAVKESADQERAANLERAASLDCDTERNAAFRHGFHFGSVGTISACLAAVSCPFERPEPLVSVTIGSTLVQKAVAAYIAGGGGAQ